MKQTLLIFLVLFFVGFEARAAEDFVTIDLAEDHIDITTGFIGGQLILFGETREKGDIAIVVEGPERITSVWRKGRVLGIWMNKDSMKFRNVPVYYDYAMSKPEANIAPLSILKEYGIGLNALFFEPDDDKSKAEAVLKFQEALIRNKQKSRLFPLNAKDIRFLSDGFFRASFHVPSNVPTGTYNIHAYFIQDGVVVEEDIKQLRVAQVGGGANVFQFAHRHAFTYGGLCVLLAIFAGWLANVLYRRD